MTHLARPGERRTLCGIAVEHADAHVAGADVVVVVISAQMRGACRECLRQADPGEPE